MLGYDEWKLATPSEYGDEGELDGCDDCQLVAPERELEQMLIDGGPVFRRDGSQVLVCAECAAKRRAEEQLGEAA